MVELKELTPTWMKRFAMAKMQFWSPAGIPKRMISNALVRSRRRADFFRAKGASFLVSAMRMSTAERYWEMMLAKATPATSMRTTSTKKRLSTMLSTPANVRNRRGRRVSPRALKMALPKL